MPTHGSRVHVYTFQETAPTILLHSGISTAYTVVKVVFGIDREYVHIRSRSLCQPNVIITRGYSLKNGIYFSKSIYISNTLNFQILDLNIFFKNIPFQFIQLNLEFIAFIKRIEINFLLLKLSKLNFLLY